MHPLSWAARLRGAARALLRRSRMEHDFSDEIHFHLDMQTEQHMRQGLSRDAARRIALLDFGGVERMREDHRDARGTRLLEDVAADARYALRWLVRVKAFTVSAIVTLALGIGGATAVFTVVDGVLLKPLPYREPQRLVAVWSMGDTTSTEPFSTSPPDFRALRDGVSAFDGVAAYYETATNVVAGDEPARFTAVRASAGLFAVLGVPALIGRTFRPEEDTWGSDRVVVLSHGAWTQRFGAQRDVVGRAVVVEGEPHVVIGVMPPSFRFPNRDADVWLPLSFPPGSRQNTRGNYFLNMVGRVRAGTSFQQAGADLMRAARQILADEPRAVIRGARLVPLHDEMVGDARRSLVLLLGATALLLTIACANVAGLLLARAQARRRELAVRASLGAARSRLVRQLVTEGMVLGVAGGAAGAALAWAGVRALLAFGPSLPRLEEVAVDGRAFAMATAVSLVAAIAFGLWPALRLTRGDQQQGLRETARSSTTREHQRARRVLVAAQVALALVLLAGSGLLVRSFIEAMRMGPGFRATDLVTGSIKLPRTRYDSHERTWELADRLAERVASDPRVRSVAITSALTLRGGQWGKLVSFADRAPAPSMNDMATTNFRLVSRDYFRTFDIPIIAGRVFGAEDHARSAPVAVVNQAMARKYWPEGDPIGKIIWMGPPEQLLPHLPPDYRFPRLTVVGVVANERFAGLDVSPSPEVYQLYAQSTEASSTIYVAIRGADAGAMLRQARLALAEIDPTLPLAQAATVSELVRESSGRRRLGVMLVSTFALLALALAVVGIYGVATQFVAQRTREIGIRMALGAGDAGVARMVLREAVATAAVGAALGLATALALSRLLKDYVFEITPNDPLTFAVVTAILFVAVILATLGPVRRATRIPPSLVLRGE